MKFEKSRTSLPFRFPAIYNFVMLFFASRKEKKILKNLVGEHKTVLDVGCGYGRYKNFIDSTCQYYGFDLNEIFVEYARRHGREVIVGNVLDPGVYREVDVVLLIDVLHHLPPEKVNDVVELAVANCREKLIIIEPLFWIPQNRLLDKLLIKFTHTFEKDGVSNVHPRYTHNEQMQLFQDFPTKFSTIKKLETFCLRKHIFAVYDLGETQ